MLALVTEHEEVMNMTRSMKRRADSTAQAAENDSGISSQTKKNEAGRPT
jgi:hypothetical protein